MNFLPDEKEKRDDRLRKIDKRLRVGFKKQTTLATEFNVSTRTIQDDLDWLDKNAGEIVKDGQYYKYKDGKYTPNPFGFNENESIALSLAFMALKQYCGTIFSERLNSFLKDEIAKKIELEIAENLWGKENVIIFNTPHNFSPNAIPQKYNQTIYELFLARKERQKIKISYKKPKDNEHGERIIRPYFFVNEEGEWSVWGHCEKQNDMRHFKIARIASTEIINDYFEIPPEYDSKEYFEEGFDNYNDGRELNYLIRFDNKVAPHLSTRLHHKSQKIKKLDDGGCEITFKCCGLDAVAKWVYKYTSHAKVIEPKELVELVKDELEKTRKIYY